MTYNNVPSENSGSFDDLQSIADSKVEGPSCPPSNAFPLNELCQQFLLSTTSLDSTDDDYSDYSDYSNHSDDSDDSDDNEVNEDNYYDVHRSQLDYVQVRISCNNGTSIITSGSIIFGYPYSYIPIEKVKSLTQVDCFVSRVKLLPGTSKNESYACVGEILHGTDRRGLVVVLASQLSFFFDQIKVELVV